MRRIRSVRHRNSLADSGPIIVGIVAALIGFMGNVIATYFQGRNSLEIERQKQQGSLIIEAIKTGNPDSAATNLKFLLEAGLINDPSGQLRRYISRQGQVPVLPARTEPFLPFDVGEPVQKLQPTDERLKNVSSVGELVIDDGQCTTFLVSNDIVVTTSFCADRVRARVSKVRFGYTSKSSKVSEYRVIGILEKDVSRSFAVIKLDAAAGARFGVIPLRSRLAVVGEPVFLIHHSQLAPLAISSGQVRRVSKDDIAHDCDTLAGASGAPMFAATDFALLGFHSRGFRPESHDFLNHAVPMQPLLESSAIIRQLRHGR